MMMKKIVTLASMKIFFAQLPVPGFTLDKNTAIVIIDLKNEY